ncbi:MAG TPA: hypothetical protein DSN98_03270 [Thermoplasmata archaeon]|jgi:hypothetical protein|nr:MAG TPA: hypothetical protein DSN98_03270 [Thermoplasmata archaeon]
MVDCEECDKKIGILGGYRHPVLGIRFLVCGTCFDKVNRDMKKWSEFCISDSFDAESTKTDIQEAWNKNISNDPPLQKWFRNLWLKEELPI